MVYVFLADGFEDIEALAPIDILKRAGANVITVGVSNNIIKSSHGVKFITDTTIDKISLNDDPEMIVLPGGMPGTINLESNDIVQNFIDYCYTNNKYIAAICAAPSILGHKNLLQGKKAICYPGFEKDLYGAEIINESVVIDQKIITAVGAGAAIKFGLALVEALFGKDKKVNIKKLLQCR